MLAWFGRRIAPETQLSLNEPNSVGARARHNMRIETASFPPPAVYPTNG